MKTSLNIAVLPVKWIFKLPQTNFSVWNLIIDLKLKVDIKIMKIDLKTAN